MVYVEIENEKAFRKHKQLLPTCYSLYRALKPHRNKISNFFKCI